MSVQQQLSVITDGDINRKRQQQLSVITDGDINRKRFHGTDAHAAKIGKDVSFI